MIIDNPDVERLLDEVAGLAGETRAQAIRRALEERRDRLSARKLQEYDVAARLAALDALQHSLALTPEAADAWVAEVRAERDAHRLPGEAG